MIPNIAKIWLKIATSSHSVNSNESGELQFSHEDSTNSPKGLLLPEIYVEIQDMERSTTNKIEITNPKLLDMGLHRAWNPGKKTKLQTSEEEEGGRGGSSIQDQGNLHTGQASRHENFFGVAKNFCLK